MVEPAGEDGDGGGLEVDEFETHADFGLHDADSGESFDAFIFARQGDAGARFHWQRLAGADEAAAEGQVRSYAIRADTGFEIEDFRVRCERITDSVAAVADAGFARRSVRDSFVHGDNVAHND